MITIREYRDADFESVARLVRDVFTEFVMPDASPEGVLWWTEYHSLHPQHREEVRTRFDACPIRYVAVDNDRIIGTAMGTAEELVRIFVRTSYHGRGIGKSLFEQFEKDCATMGSVRYRITSALCSISFYQKLGCKKTTGIRNLHGLKVQPMRKNLGSTFDRRGDSNCTTDLDNM